MTSNLSRSEHGLLHLVGVAPTLIALLRREMDLVLSIETMTDQDALYARFQEGQRPPDTVLLGMEIAEPVRMRNVAFRREAASSSRWATGRNVMCPAIEAEGLR